MNDRVENWARTITDAVVALPDVPYSQKQEITVAMREIGEHDCLVDLSARVVKLENQIRKLDRTID